MRIIYRDGSGTMHVRWVIEDTDRHGNVRVYFRRNGVKIRLRSTPGTPEFDEEYGRALAGTPARKRGDKHVTPIQHGSLRWLCAEYFRSPAFKSLVRGNVRRRILELICETKIKDASGNETGRPLGDLPYNGIAKRHVLTLRNQRADRPEAGNVRVKALRQLFAWAGEERDLMGSNPAREVKYLPSNNPDGFHTWSVEEVEQYQMRHKLGTMARLALDLMANTGVRRSDVVRLGRPMERDGWLNFTEAKGRNRKVKHRAIPILEPLRASIDAAEASQRPTYLVTAFGKPFTANGFGNWFRKRCTEAGLPEHCSAHGLRKAGATIAAENGASEHELMAIFGWSSPKQAALYTRSADRKRLAGSAMHLLAPKQRLGEKVPLSTPASSGGTSSDEILNQIKEGIERVVPRAGFVKGHPSGALRIRA